MEDEEKGTLGLLWAVTCVKEVRGRDWMMTPLGTHIPWSTVGVCEFRLEKRRILKILYFSSWDMYLGKHATGMEDTRPRFIFIHIHVSAQFFQQVRVV